MRTTAVFCAVALFAIVPTSVVAADTGETAVVDRLEGGKAVLLVETDGETTDRRVVDVEETPAEGQHEGAVLRPVDGGYVYDESETDRRRSAAGDRFDRLAERAGDPGAGRSGVCGLGPLRHLWWC